MAARIEDYAIIGDLQTVGLVSNTGSIDWLCLPRFDSAACFAALLGTRDNGHWTIAPRSAGRTGKVSLRQYRGDTLILESEWNTREGMVRVIDFMPPRDQAPDVMRIVEGVSGNVPMRSVLRLRMDYGSVIPWVRKVDHQVVAVAGPDACWLRSDVPTYGKDFATYADFTVGPGERVSFVLTWNPSHLPPPVPADPNVMLAQTEAIWQQWIAESSYDGDWPDAVRRSLLTLKALTYEPTGGIVAAPTTSLPEEIGGVRNWDYRYCWLRDATMTLAALLRSGYTEEAMAWRMWLLRAIAGSASNLRIMYGLAGERRLPEQELDWLTGYEGSRPVRIGNAAVDQVQLDVYGEVLNALYLARTASLAGSKMSWPLERVLLKHLEERWHEPDHGIWEIRAPRRQFTHSKVMAWVAMDRAIKSAERFGLRGDLARWRAVRDEIRAEVLAKGYDADRNTFTQTFGSRDLDAAQLLIPIVGFLPPDDPRVVGTVEAIQRELTQDGLVRRYHIEPDGESELDGLPGGEGTFLACSFWLATDLHLIGREAEARELFEHLLALRNDVGLLAEEYDPKAGRMLGNFPQAYSHIALINTAIELSSPRRPH